MHMILDAISSFLPLKYFAVFILLSQMTEATQNVRIRASGNLNRWSHVSLKRVG